MPGLMIWLIMNALKKSKPNNIHYVPRDYEAVRNQGRENSTKLPLPKNTVKEKTPYGCWYCKPGANRKKVLFYIHGGGFNSGGAEYSINMTRNFCKSDNYAVFNVEYRLAPEHPFPAGLEDCISAYRYLTQQGVHGSDKLSTGSSGEDTVFGAGNALTEKAVATYTYRTDIQTIADMNYAIVHKALCKYSVFKFNTLKSYFPNLKSTREFITSPNYLGAIEIEITSKYETPTPSILFSACVNVLGKVAESVSDIEITYVGTTEFKPTRISKMFKDKKCNYTIVHDGGLGYSQNDASVPNGWKIDLSKEDWFAFEDNFGTSEEKAFVAYFKSFIPHLKEKYDKVFLVRNERQLHIYSFDGGERFEPDYLLFLHKQNDAGYEQLQVFIEPKGTHLIADDKWKEDFLLEIEDKAVTTKIFVDDNKYKIWGFHFFNTDVRMNEFKKDMERL